ncbi:MAG: signal peptidase I [Anaerolineae bacterium]|nr:signal peptidase I [Anaerolineae bacterium]
MNNLNIHEDTLLTQGKSYTLRQALIQLFKEILTTALPALVMAFLITNFVGERTVVLGQSMEPNLHQDQQLIIDKVSYRFHAPKRGDIVVVDVETSEIPYIKRVIGLPGETLEIRNNRVYINGTVLSEPYLFEVQQWNYGPVQIPADHVFVMGDNRANSSDSRILGPIPQEDILARAWISVWPLEDVGVLK